MKLAMLQMSVTSQKSENIKKACQGIGICADRGAEMVVLPEMFVCPYENEAFLTNAEEKDELIYETMRRAARENHVWVVAGSFPEKEGEKIYNTSFVFNDKGEEAARHRKLHLFDIDIEGGQRFRESDIFSAGDSITVFDTPFGKMGLMICFDLRFPELARAMTLSGAKLLLAPASFNKTTGPMHWDLLLRARAVDNGVFLAAVSTARNDCASYVSYGHSAIVSPWGEFVMHMGDDEAIGMAEVDFSFVEAVRRQLPILSARRTDLY